MRAKFYIHIGVPKTGTKSIQYALSDNRATLLAHGINSLPGGPNHGPALISLLRDDPHDTSRNIRRHLDTPEKTASFNSSISFQIKKALEQNVSGKMVISGEGLSGLSATEIERLQAMFAPHAAGYRILVYVRDPYEYANSAFLQRLKSGSTLDKPRKRLPLPEYRDKLQTYLDAFGRENVDIRIFDRRRFIGGDLISDFLAAIDESPHLAQSLNVEHANQSMSHEAAVILSEANAVVPVLINRRANRARAFGFHMYIVGIRGERFAIDPQHYLEHEPEIAADIKWLNQILGEQVFGRADPKPASVPRWGQSSIDSIKGVLAGMASELQQLEENQYPPEVQRPPLPAELGWLRDVYHHGTFPAAEGKQPISPQFDQATVRSLGCFLHAVALAIQHMKANKSAHNSRFTIWKSPRKAEDQYRELVRRNPANAAAQYRLSQAHLLRGHLAEARKTAQAAAALAPGRARFRLWLRLLNVAGRLMLRPGSHQSQA
ncbi:MAG: hypothetical protein QOD94_3119 [Alphaproteobacteria bacterium]|jgi:hypothetical protein|nr:hypothetical protein [Alphaproteobacteria bacterium]